MKALIFTFLFLSGVSAFSQFPNVIVGTYDNPEEPSIAINPKNPGIIAAGSNVRYYYYSDDSGHSWTWGSMTSSFGVYGDPCLIVDTSGYFYYFHLSYPSSSAWLDRIVCQKSIDNGHTWNDGSFTGLNGTKQNDKEWAVVDPATNNIYLTWTRFDKYGSSIPTDSSNIVFSRSVDGAQSWSTPVRINKVAGNCLDGDGTVEGAVPAVGPNGEIYVSWAGPAGLVFTKSTDGGITWPSDNILVSDMPGGWDFNVPGIYRCNGFPVTCCDLSNGPHRGTVYINWSDQRNGSTDTDIFLSKSTDGGTTWCAPKRVNDDPPGNQQFFTWMTVDQTSGYLYFVFYDRRNYADYRADVYMAISRDGGETFYNFQVSDSSFTPNHSVFFGDYTNISAVNNTVRPIWARMVNNKCRVMTALVDSANLVYVPEQERKLPVRLNQNYPNPAISCTFLPFDLSRPSTVSLRIYDLFGHLLATIIDRKFLPAGEYVETFYFSDHNLSKGVYIYQLTTGEQAFSRKMVVE